MAAAPLLMGHSSQAGLAGQIEMAVWLIRRAYAAREHGAEPLSPGLGIRIWRRARDQ
jgi:hypothetical protein